MIEDEDGLVGVEYVTGTDLTFSYLGSFPAVASQPTVTNSAADTITDTSAVLYGEVTDDGGDTVTTVGFEWDTDSGAPYANDINEAYSAAEFDMIASSLPPDTTIYWRAYATNGEGTGYSSELNFDTLLPYPNPPTGTSITQTGTGDITIDWTTGDYADGTIIIWDLDIGQVQTLEGHSHWVNSVVWLSDKKSLASGSWDGTIRIWEILDIYVQ